MFRGCFEEAGNKNGTSTGVAKRTYQINYYLSINTVENSINMRPYQHTKLRILINR